LFQLELSEIKRERTGARARNKLDILDDSAQAFFNLTQDCPYLIVDFE
jgi:hypothetical protein